jgi:4-methyl-5(b-hydroxyethyl)-thiazole monophosphate biosynthesis
MARVLVPLAEGFEEIEAVVIIDVLRRAGLEVFTAGLKPGSVTGAHELTVQPDLDLDAALKTNYDMLVLPGGQPGTDHLRTDRRVIDLVRKMDQKKSLIGAICAAPLVLRDAGIAAGRMLTSYPGMEGEFKDSRYSQTRVAVDGHLVTGRGPGAALEFALKLVEIVQGQAKAAALAGKMVAAG